MASRTIWWKIGDHDEVTENKTRTKTHDLCPECGAPYGIHGKVGATLVHPGDAIIVNNKGAVRIERPDPMAQAVADMEPA